MKHASFFSGAGGLDIGFERAGISTVSVSEVDPYACAVLAERFPDAPNLGDITEVQADDIPEAQVWSGGFPCQDLSVAGKRAGFAGKRSSLAFTFLDLVEQRRPRWLVLENVPGLFSSNQGRDFGRLLNEMDALGYGVAWRTLDARHFGVAQRRRRVFIVGSLESDRASEVLLECEGCERHPAPSWTQRQGIAGGASDGSGIAGAITRRFSKGVNSTIDEPLIVSPTPDADRVRAADGLARRLDNQPPMAYQTRADEKNGNFSLSEASVANSLSALWPGDTSHRSMTLVQAVMRIGAFAQYVKDDTAASLRANGGDSGGGSENLAMLSFPSRFGSNANVTEGLAQSMAHSAGAPAVLLDSLADTREEDNLLPIGLDSHRYRLCGNGVVAPVAEWIGRRLIEADRRWRQEEVK
jgi:DNA-cytosine methyltransferase